MLKIYGRANSINVRKVLWLCDEIGLPFEREDWGRGYRALNEEPFASLNPQSLIPVIDDDGFVLGQSNAILRYLSAKHGRVDLYPIDLKVRATIDAALDWTSSDVYVPLAAVFHGIALKTPGRTDPAQIAAGISAWTKLMRVIDVELARIGGPYWMGRDFTLADIAVGLIVNRWFMIPFDKPELSHVSRYYDHLASRAPFRAHGRNGLP
jgi:glutathione S-transferase